jgi:hypothetical protein
MSGSSRLTTEQFQKWLVKDAPSDKAKEYILMLLGGVPPSRDFMRGIKVTIRSTFDSA